jgi:hypothetical protein
LSLPREACVYSTPAGALHRIRWTIPSFQVGFVVPDLSKVLANERVNALAFDKKLTAGLHSPRTNRNHKDDDVGGSVNR